MPVYTVNESLCRKDGICSAVCPANIIKGEKGEIPHLVEHGEKRCIGCGQCVVFCPTGAVALEGLPMDKALPVDRDKLPTAEQTAMLLKSRRSVRMYKKEPVPRSLLLEIIDTAHYAPTATNRQPVRWVLVYDRSDVIKLGDLMAQAMTAFASQNPKDPFAFAARALAASWGRGNDPFFRGAPHLACAVTPSAEEWTWGTIDAAIALSYLEIAAAPHNVGACWAGYFTNMCAFYPPLREAVGVKENELMAGAQMLGFSALKARLLPPRPEAPVEWR